MNIITEIIGKKTKNFLIFFSISIPFVGHFSAYLYYLSFGIEYFRFSSWTSGARFLWEHVDNIISGSAVSIIVYCLITIFLLPLIDKYEENNKNKISLILNKFHYICFAIVIIAIFIIYLEEGKKEFQVVDNEVYIPYIISLKSKEKIKCVRSLGTIGDYRIFVRKGSRLIVRDDEILTATPLALKSPVLSLFLKSPDDYSSWSIFWDKECKRSGGDDSFNHSFPKLSFWVRWFPSYSSTKISKPE